MRVSRYLADMMRDTDGRVPDHPRRSRSPLSHAVKIWSITCFIRITGCLLSSSQSTRFLIGARSETTRSCGGSIGHVLRNVSRKYPSTCRASHWASGRLGSKNDLARLCRSGSALGRRPRPPSGCSRGASPVLIPEPARLLIGALDSEDFTPPEAAPLSASPERARSEGLCSSLICSPLSILGDKFVRGGVQFMSGEGGQVWPGSPSSPSSGPSASPSGSDLNAALIWRTSA